MIFAYDRRACVIVATGLHTYPDVTVACGQEVFEKVAGVETLTNPLVVFEVLSDSTEKYDRGQKFEIEVEEIYLKVFAETGEAAPA